MKKNITINLFGQLYHIDEDAYELLKKYEDNMRSYFRNKEGGEEIADDIAHRVAELIAEIKSSGTEAITIEHIEGIIRRIGNPEQMDDENNEATDNNAASNDVETQPTKEKSWFKQRRLFRDSKNTMIGGVLSGLCHYFGGSDPLPWRLIFVILAFFSVSTLCILYLILWAIIPVANTAEERLLMKGKAVNAQNLNEEIIGEGKDVNSKSNAPTCSTSNNRGGCCQSLLHLIVLIFKVGIVTIAGIMLFSICMMLVPLILFTFGGASMMLTWGWLSPDQVEVFNLLPTLTWQIWLLAISGIIATVLPIYVLLRRLFAPHKPASSTGRRTIYIIIWIFSIVAFLTSLVTLVMHLEQAQDEYFDKLYERDGISIRYGWSSIDEGRWEMKTFSNCNTWLAQQGKNIFTGTKGHNYFRFERDGKLNQTMRSRIERGEHFGKGLYKVCAVATSQGNGCYIYAQLPGDSTARFTKVPLWKDSTMTISHIDWECASTMPYFLNNMTEHTPQAWTRVQERADKKGWAYVESDTLHHPGGTIRYGITNDIDFTHKAWEGDWYQMYDVQIISIDNKK